MRLGRSKLGELRPSRVNGKATLSRLVYPSYGEPFRTRGVNNKNKTTSIQAPLRLGVKNEIIHVTLTNIIPIEAVGISQKGVKLTS